MKLLLRHRKPGRDKPSGRKCNKTRPHRVPARFSRVRVVPDDEARE